ncbi:MAG: hypothetical protein L6Q99_18855 [Planctomycetes bacterium]|nr:hypothetical protein [Planctomycetota bacterium]
MTAEAAGADEGPQAASNESEPLWAPLSARDFAARFAAVEVLFEAREGKTYRARDRAREGREVSLSVLLARVGRPREAIDGFFQDLRTAQSLVSPHLVEIVDVGGLEDGRLFVATELVQGESLATRLTREGELRVEVALEIARQVLAALGVAHSKSLAHGAIEPRHVWLAARVPKTAENPDGIHVRLAGFGLATLLASDPIETGVAAAPTTAGDLAAVAALVERMVGESGANDPRVRALVARVGDREENAEVLARSVQATSAGAGKARMPRWAIAGLGVLGIAAITEGFLWLEQRSESQKLAENVAQAELEKIRAQREQEQYCNAKMEELHEQIRRRDEEITALGQKLERELALAAQRADGSASREELEKIRRELDATKGEREKLAVSLVETQNRAKELEREKLKILAENTPGARAARGFERLLTLVGEGKGKDALAHFEALAKSDALGAESERAAAWMRHFALAAAALEDARGAAHPGSALQRAQTELAELAALERGFAVEANAWNARGLEDGDGIDRAAAGERALAELSQRIAAAAREIDRAHVDDWQRVRALPQTSEPDTILEHVARFGCGHLDEWTGAVGAQLELELVKNGVLDVNALCDSDLLETWSEADAAAAPLADWFAARAWYCDDEPAQGELAVPALAKSEPHADWRATLALERALATSPNLPLATGWIAVWRDSDLLRKTTAWYVDELVAESGEGDERNWEIRRAVYVGDGLTPSNAQRVVLARRGDQFTRSGKPILDVREHASSVKVALWRADAALTPPAKSWFPSKDELATFRSELAGRDEPVLVSSDGTLTRWFSPKLGLVREEAPGVFRMELAYLGPKR